MAQISKNESRPPSEVNLSFSILRRLSYSTIRPSRWSTKQPDRFKRPLSLPSKLSLRGLKLDPGRQDTQSIASGVQTAERHTEALQNLHPDPRYREPGSVVRQSKDYRHIVLSRTHRIQAQSTPRGLWLPRCRLVMAGFFALLS